jgi:hypothetical protein
MKMQCFRTSPLLAQSVKKENEKERTIVPKHCKAARATKDEQHGWSSLV